MKRYLLFLFVLIIGANVHAQNLSLRIASFKDVPTDLTRVSKIDPGSGDPYALIKVTSDNPGDDLRAYRFDFNLLAHETEMHDGELWLYVQKNAKVVTIKRDGYNTINRQSLGYTLESGKVYRMLLSAQTPEVKHRIVQFKVNPANEGAIVKVKRSDSSGDYDFWGQVGPDGTIDRRIETGVYVYEVSAEHYEASEGRINLTYADEPWVEEVTLTPNFGYLEVDDTYGITGAEIYVNNRKIGTVPYTSNERWDVRDDYHIMITNGELYKTYNSTFAIRKGQTTKLSPKLESNFAETTLTVANDAEIWVDGVKKSQGKWTGPLRAGTYKVECRLPDHRSTTRQITIRPNVAETFTLAAPIPIVGSIYVSTNPSGAKISIDGKEVGFTPREVKDMLIGSHTVSVTLTGYRTEEKTVYVEEGKTAEVSFTLRDFANFQITSSPNARLTLDGKYVGTTPYSFEGASGEYDIMLTASKCQTFHKKVMLKSSDPYFKVSLQRQYQSKSNFYIHAGLQAGSFMAMEGTLGCYLGNVNIEASYLLGMSKSEDIYWNNTGTSEEPVLFTYKPTGYSFKLGYGIVCGTRLRITPQVGATIVTFKGDTDSNETSEGNVSSATVGARLDYAVASCFGLYAAPELSFAVQKSDVYDQLSEVSSKIKGWGNGFNIRVGLCLFF